MYNLLIIVTIHEHKYDMIPIHITDIMKVRMKFSWFFLLQAGIVSVKMIKTGHVITQRINWKVLSWGMVHGDKSSSMSDSSDWKSININTDLNYSKVIIY